MYDASMSRWSTVDPLAEKREWLTPYNMNQNNPINRIDPDGALDEPCCGGVVDFSIGVGKGFYGGIKGTVMGIVNTVQHPIETAQGIGSAIVNYEATGSAIKGATIETYDKFVSGSAQDRGEVVGAGVALVGEALFGTKGLSKINSLSKVGKVSPNVQKVLNTIGDFKKAGGEVKVNPLDSKYMQELNITFKNSDGSKLDLRVETHKLPQTVGGNGVNPQRHLNADVTNSSGNRVKMKHINGGHKILEK
jgi:hypothetical protein